MGPLALVSSRVNQKTKVDESSMSRTSLQCLHRSLLASSLAPSLETEHSQTCLRTIAVCLQETPRDQGLRKRVSRSLWRPRRPVTSRALSRAAVSQRSTTVRWYRSRPRPALCGRWLRQKKTFLFNPTIHNPKNGNCTTDFGKGRKQKE